MIAKLTAREDGDIIIHTEDISGAREYSSSKGDIEVKYTYISMINGHAWEVKESLKEVVKLMRKARG